MRELALRRRLPPVAVVLESLARTRGFLERRNLCVIETAGETSPSAAPVVGI